MTEPANNSERAAVRALLLSSADDADPGPAPIRQILHAGRRRRLRALGSIGVPAACLVILAVVFWQLGWPSGPNEPASRTVRPDHYAIAQGLRVSAPERPHPSEIRYVSATPQGLRAAGFFTDPPDSLGVPDGTPLILVLVTGPYRGDHPAPPPPDLPSTTFTFDTSAPYLGLVLAADSHRQVQGGLMNSSALAAMAHLGDVTDCRMSYRGGPPTAECHVGG